MDRPTVGVVRQLIHIFLYYYIRVTAAVKSYSEKLDYNPKEECLENRNQNITMTIHKKIFTLSYNMHFLFINETEK